MHFKTLRTGLKILCFYMVVVAFGCVKEGERAEGAILLPTGKPAEGEVDVFLGDPYFLKQVIDTGKHVRFPIVTTGVEGTVLVFWGHDMMNIQRSVDGGISWDEKNQFNDMPSLFNSNPIVDEISGDLLIVSLESDEDIVWRSKDQGVTWVKETITVMPNEAIKWMELTGIMKRVKKEGYGKRNDGYWLRTSHGESGITLQHGEKKGRLIMYAAFRPHSTVHPSDRDSVDVIFSTAIYSDDGGATWQMSGFFPEGYTEEASLAELHDGRIYYNSRSHKGFRDKSLVRELRPDETLRREAWSYDDGQTWDGLRVSKVLPDGGGYSMGYGMMGGLVRLPVKNRDVLLYSNTDTGGGEREKMTVWASFDGGQTWPLKRLVNAGPSAYSSLAAGRPGTASEGNVYLVFEGSETQRYGGIQVARFNLSWILEGELTGDGAVPDLTTWGK